MTEHKYLLMQFCKKMRVGMEQGFKENMWFYLFFLKGENAILILRSNLSKEQNKKTNMFSQQCQFHMWFSFLRPKMCLKKKPKNKYCKPIFVTTMSNAKRVFLINISRITVQFLSLSHYYNNYIKIKWNKYCIVGPTTPRECFLLI